MNSLKNAVGIPVREWADGPWSLALREMRKNNYSRSESAYNHGFSRTSHGEENDGRRCARSICERHANVLGLPDHAGAFSGG